MPESTPIEAKVKEIADFFYRFKLENDHLGYGVALNTWVESDSARKLIEELGSGGVGEAPTYKSMLTDIILECEYGNKEIDLVKRIASIFNKHPEVVIGHNSVSQSVGIAYSPANTDVQKEEGMAGYGWAAIFKY